MKKHIISLLNLIFLFFTVQAQNQWWLDEPVRLLQTNLPLHMVPDYNPDQLVTQIEQAGANTWLFNVGGIYAYYPTELEYHAINPFMNPDQDFAGELIRRAKAKGIRVIGRYDFSRFTDEIANAHPEWCFQRATGETISFNGLTTSCLFAGYYQEYALKIIEEGMSRYELDGILINWWGNHGTNGYTGVPNGVCHCSSCQQSWATFSENPFPEDFTPEYHAWHNQAKSDLVSRVQEVIRKYSDQTALIIHHLTGDREKIEGFTTETRTGSESNDWWPYQSSYYVNKYHNSHPDKGVFNTVVNFIDYNFRFAPHRTNVIQTRMLQSMAHGTFPAFYMIGMPDQQDTTGAAAVFYPFQVHQKNEKQYIRQESAARTVLIDDGLSDGMKGVIAILSEAHIPYKIIFEEKLSHHEADATLFITTGPVSAGLLEAVQKGKNLICIGTTPPPVFESEVIGQISEEDLKKSYWLVQDSLIFPRLSKHRILFNPSDYTELRPDASAPIVLIPPARSAPPELVWTNMKVSDKPGIAVKEYGKGKIVWIPWKATDIYYHHATTSIRVMMEELIDHLTDSRQVLTDAHPLVEISWMKRPDGVHQLHLVNLTGQVHGSQNRIIPMEALTFKVKGNFRTATSSVGNNLPVREENGYAVFTVPYLDAYELVELR